jgi:hypothetical protein
MKHWCRYPALWAFSHVVLSRFSLDDKLLVRKRQVDKNVTLFAFPVMPIRDLQSYTAAPVASSWRLSTVSSSTCA